MIDAKLASQDVKLSIPAAEKEELPTPQLILDVRRALLDFSIEKQRQSCDEEFELESSSTVCTSQDDLRQFPTPASSLSR